MPDVVDRLVAHVGGGAGDAVLTGPSGFGIGHSVRQILLALEQDGHEVELVDPLAGVTGDPSVVVLDARRGHDPAAAATALREHRAAGRRFVLVVPQRPDTDVFTAAARGLGATVFVLRPWTSDQVRRVLRERGLASRDPEQVAALTGGLPWLIRFIGASPEDDPLASGPHAPPPDRIAAFVLGLLDGCSPEVADAALALAVGYPVAGRPELPVADPSRELGHDLLLRWVDSAGLIGADGSLPPLVRDCIRAHAPAHRVGRWRQRLVDDILATGEDLRSYAPDLVAQGVRDGRVVQALVDAALARCQPSGTGCWSIGAGFEQHAASTVDLLRLAVEAGAEDPEVHISLAHHALLLGDVPTAAAEIDRVLAGQGGDVPETLLPLALEIAWAADLPHRVTDLVRWVGDRDPAGADHPALAMSRYSVGDRPGGDQVLRRAIQAGDPRNSGGILLTEGMRTTLDSDGAASLPELMHAVEASDRGTGEGFRADAPVSIVALWGLHAGDLALVDSVLGRALEETSLGPLARTRLEVLRAWGALTRGDLERAASLIEPIGPAAPRDELWLAALRVGLARRADDPARLRSEWQEARQTVLRHPVSLTQLLPLGELALSAARNHDFDLVRPQWEQAAGLLAALGEPPVWATPFHWYALQIHLQMDAPKQVAPHAAALVRASAQWEHAAVLAAAGRAWVRVRGRDVDAGEVERAARGLARAGLPWEAARLAAHGAAAAPDRRVSTRLLESARELYPRAQSSAPRTVGGVTVRDTLPEDVRGVAMHLTEREWQVAQLVVEGRTYKQVGEILFLSPKTVEHHIARIRRRSGAGSRAELLELLHAAVARRAGAAG